MISRDLIKFSAYNQMYQVKTSHPNFNEIKYLLSSGKTRAAVTSYNKGLSKTVKSGFITKDNNFYYKGQKLPIIFAKLYKDVMQYPNQLSYLTKFFDSVLANPSRISVQSFGDFIEKRRMPITDRGTFLAYKRINGAWCDSHTGNVFNKPAELMSQEELSRYSQPQTTNRGDVVQVKDGYTNISMARERVNPDQNQNCSTGFHACSYEYLGSFVDERLVIVEIKPEHVVSVPSDYSYSKMRVCEYTVLCTGNKFRDIVGSKAQDILGSIPLFITSKNGFK
jgi:hypothetical protein